MQVSKRIYAGNGVTRRWEVDFPLASPQDVRVYVTSPAGAETELAEDFELNAAGTELEYPTLSSGKPPLAEGWSLTLERHTPLTQEIDLLRQGELDAEVLESGYDKLTLMVQELNEKVSRSIKYPVSSIVDNLETDSFLRNILSIKQDALNASSAAVSSAQQAQASASSAQQTAQSALAAIASSKDSAQSDIAASGAAVENTLQTYVSAAQNEAETARYYAERSIGKTVGEVYYSQSSAETDNPGALPLFTGETITSADTLYPDFYAWLQNHSGLTCTAAEYAAALSMYGECPKYVLADGNLRLPLFKHSIKAANTEDGITQGAAGGFTGVPDYSAGYTITSGTALTEDALVTCTGSPGGYSTINITVDGKEVYRGGVSENTARPRAGNIYAAKGSVISTGQGTLTVYPLKARQSGYVTLYPWVCAYNAAVPASTAQAAQFQAALSGKVDVPSGKTQADVDFVVESYSDASGNWYRQYKSGWVAQGGIKTNSADSDVITFLKPYADTNYKFWSSCKVSSSDNQPRTFAEILGTRTPTGITIKSLPYLAETKGDWFAIGQGE